MRQKNEKIEKACMYCEKSLVCEKDSEISVICDIKGEVSPIGSCFRFRYDPLKRRVERAPTPLPFTEESV